MFNLNNPYFEIFTYSTKMLAGWIPGSAFGEIKQSIDDGKLHQAQQKILYEYVHNWKVTM